ncbi:inositol monophosphatase family protein [Tumebacillus permanentifrigoris]|uniref:Inositol-1-monophosphatase n=1 Tax=Tumebacillus permanentifrigoris TaxID=378543 RepID=A0A316D2E4_9BACL|nr:inositol monophosphatase family protein [Tumebacillus permanentifrigoris]PWK05044.1 myo-inositol-1(or 4)-monophosphatase [Tumebacillus permanentifrigoris]
MNSLQIEEQAILAAREAGALIRQKCGRAAQTIVKSNDYDLVTEVDKACEELIRRRLAEQAPTHHILGEEGVAPGSAASAQAVEESRDAEVLWIIDPIDGTTNFIHGFPNSVVSIGVAQRGELLVGVIYDPFRDEMFTARRGEGAFLNGERLSVSKEATLQESVLATGFPVDTKGARAINMRGMQALAPTVRNFRALGTAALHLAYVAAGRLTGFWEMDLNAWDLSAGSLLIQEAGGRVTDTRGVEYHLGVRHIAATNGLVHDDLLRVLVESRATGYEAE